MHTNRYFVHTLKNTPALIRYRLRALTCLVARHSRRKSGSVRVCLTTETLAAKLCIFSFTPTLGTVRIILLIVTSTIITLCVDHSVDSGLSLYSEALLNTVVEAVVFFTN